MKFLIIGASGFVGRHLLAYVKSEGYDVIGTQSHSLYPRLITFNLLEHRIKDRVAPDFFDTNHQIFAVICVAISQIDRCFLEREISHKINVDNTIRLIDDLTKKNVKPIFLSSDNVYDGRLGFYNEHHKPNPINEYGRQKVKVESYIKQNIPKGLVLRLSKIVGDDPSEHHLFSEWYKLVEKNQPIICIEKQIFSPTFVKDVASGIVLSCKKGLLGLYNMANPEFFQRGELARQFILMLGKKVDIISKPQSEFKFSDKRPEKTYLDSSKFMKVTGMKFTPMGEALNIFIQNLQLTLKRVQQ